MKTADISVEYIQHTGSDLQVANAARVSFDKVGEWEYDSENPTICIESPHNGAGYTIVDPGVVRTLSEKDAKLIRYLAKHKHFSPFNHSFITLRIKAPVFVARQLVKHKFMPWNEVSRRYVDDEPEFYFPTLWRARADNVKQGSSELPAAYMQEEQWDGTESINDTCTTEELLYRDVRRVLGMYQDMVNNGVCAEQARMILPQNMMTSWFWSGTLGAYADMLRLRLDPHTQKESRDVAEQINAIIEPLFPVALPALLAIN